MQLQFTLQNKVRTTHNHYNYFFLKSFTNSISLENLRALITLNFYQTLNKVSS